VVLALAAVPAAADGPLSLARTIPVPSNPRDLDLQGDYLYVVTDAGLTVVDLRDPAAPTIRGTVPTPQANTGIKVRGNYAYIAGNTGGFHIADVSDPDNPVLVSRTLIPYAFDVALKDDVAYVSSLAGELYVLDVSDPLVPAPRLKVLGLPAWKTPGPDSSALSLLNRHVTSGNGKLTGLVVKDDVLIVTEWGYGRIYSHDVSNPASPRFSGTHYVPYVLKVDIDDRGIVYMLSAYGPASGIYSVPLSRLHPDFASYHAACAECGYVPSVVPFVGIDQGGMALAPGGAYLAYGGGRGEGEFNIVDVRDPLAMTTVATRPIGVHGVPVLGIMGVRVAGDLAYFAAGALGVQVYRFPGLGATGGGTPPPPPPAPAVTSFAVNGGAASTTSRTVTLNNAATGAPTEYRASEAADFAGASWLPYGAAPTFSLTGPAGTRTVHFQVRGAGGESAAVSDTIELTETTTGTAPAFTLYAINGGAGTTTSRTVTLNNAATGAPTEYRASERSDFAGASWLPYSTAPAFELSPGNATKRVYIQLRNAAGTSVARSDTINLAEPVPVFSTFAINGGLTSTTSRTVTLNNAATGDPVEYRASESSTFAGAAWLPYSTAPTFELSPGTATKRVYIQLRNAAGGQSLVRSDTIVLYE